MTAPTPLSPEVIEDDAELAIAAHGLLKQRNKFAAEIADLSRQLDETESWSHLRAEDIMTLGKELGEARAEVERLTRERDEAYATIKRIWKALGCERYEDAHGMHISELVEELRRDRDRYKAGWLAERERCARVVDTPGEFPAMLWKIAAAIRSLPAPTLPEETGDRDHYKTVVDAEREAIAAEARRYASHYPQGSDGRNTFILLAEWIEARHDA
jgi:hypothetical protein